MAKEPDAKSAEVTEVLWAGSDGPVRMIRTDEATPDAPAIGTPSPAPSAPAEPSTSPDPTKPGDHGKILALTVVRSFIDRLNEATRQNGGYLTSAEVADLSQEMEQKSEALEKVFQQSLEQYVRARERAAFDHSRQYPFDRIIVNTFAHLFDPALVAEYGADALTRRILPGFFMAVDKMLGPELMEDFQVRCRALVEQMSPGGESALDWNVVYVMPEAKTIVCDALVEMVRYFEDIEKRRDWFVALINDSLSAEDTWRLTNMGFYHLFGALFSGLRRTLTDFEDRRTLEERHGIPECEDLDRGFALIDVRMRRLIEAEDL